VTNAVELIRTAAKPVLFCWSGGKDSCMALHRLRRDPLREVVALLTTVTEGFDRISMHGVRRELLERQAASLGLPLEIVTIPPQCAGPDYESRMEAMLLTWKNRGITKVAFGDIFLEDLRELRFVATQLWQGIDFHHRSALLNGRAQIIQGPLHWFSQSHFIRGSIVAVDHLRVGQ